jgi:ABC-type lipoprotein release transport system permease subunit
LVYSEKVMVYLSLFLIFINNLKLFSALEFERVNWISNLFQSFVCEKKEVKRIFTTIGAKKGHYEKVFINHHSSIIILFS